MHRSGKLRRLFALACAPIAAGTALFMTIEEARAERAPVASVRGPHGVEQGGYRFPAAVDRDVLASAPTELWAHAWWPADKAPNAKLPIVFFLHGNHATCGSGERPRHDSNCSYTSTGQCGAGQVVVPNHMGYQYLAEQLASQGFVAVSINANRGITCSSGNADDWGLNLARGRLILRHLQEWSRWTREGGAPQELGVQASWINAVDWGRVGLFGHSRGGEGARAAYNLYLDEGSAWPAKIPGASIRAIFEVGAVDGQTSRTLDARGAAWTQLLPMCDGDVSDLQGRMPFERMLADGSETPRAPKALSMVWGANHNFFNTEWQRSDSYGCSGHEPIFDTSAWQSEKQKAIASELVLSFFRSRLNGDPLVGRGYDPLWEVSTAIASQGRVDRDFAPTADLQIFSRVDDFDGATGVSSSGAPNIASRVQVEHRSYEEPKRAEVSWQNAAEDAFFQANWAQPGTGKDASGHTVLSFRVARLEEEREKPATDFSIALTDATGAVSSSVQLSQFVDLTGPANSVITFQTARIPLSVFAGVDLRKLDGVRFIFNRTQAGSVLLANVRLAPGPSNAPIAGPGLRISRLDAIRDVSRATANASSAAHRPLVSSATWIDSPAAPASRSSRYGLQAADMQMRFRASDDFPARNALPYLKIGDRLFAGGRYRNDGGLDELTFSIPRREWESLREGSPIQIQYGKSDRPSHVWNVGRSFTKAPN